MTDRLDSLSRRTSWPSWAFIGILVLAWFAYRPGLTGGFLFDDFVNLPALGAGGTIDNAAAFWRYVTSGTADPTGRPVALLSFLVDTRDWPAQAASFLRTNVLLHLLNGALLFVLLRTLGRRLDGPSIRNDAAAVLGAALWLLHPLFVSTTLYVVQREAMLPATFTLLGLLAWVHGRQRFAADPRVGVAWMVLAFGACLALSGLSKANGFLLPLLAWVIDAVLLRPHDMPEARRSPMLRTVRGAMLIVPSVLIFAFLVSELHRLGDPLAARAWTLEQRLLTEPRVVLDYLQLLAIPRVLSTGLYNDAYVVSTGLLQPVATLFGLLAVIGLAIAGFALRRRAPALATALLFFLAGHLLESTTVALELYFEHRNYLPALLLGWPLARAVFRWNVAVKFRVAVAVALVLLLAGITWQRASLWAQQEHMAYLWAAKNPASPRAQATAAIFETKSGRADLAVARLDARARANPADLQLVLNRTSAQCAAGGLSGRDIDAVAAALRSATEGDQLLHRWLERSLMSAERDACAGLDLDTVKRWLDAAKANPNFGKRSGRRQDLHSVAGQLAIARGTPGRALADFDHALAAFPTPGAAMQQAAMLATHGCLRQALAHLDHYDRIAATLPAQTGWNMPSLHRRLLDAQGYWPAEFARLRATIQEDLSKDPTPCRE